MFFSFLQPFFWRASHEKSIRGLAGRQSSRRRSGGAGTDTADRAAGVTLEPGQPLPERPLFIPPRWDGMRVGLEVLVDGQPLRTIEYAEKTYLPVPRLGTEYAVQVWNHGPRRVAAILSVDGLSVITGRPASEADPGYIVDPGRGVVIRGWRRDLDTVAAFSFEKRQDSYAARRGWPENVGVIGLVAVEEMRSSPRPLLEERPFAVPLAKGATGEVSGTGTGYGRDIDSHVYYVPFARSDNRRTVTLYYDTVAALQEAGVPVDESLPIPFPGNSDFTPPPPGSPGK